MAKPSAKAKKSRTPKSSPKVTAPRGPAKKLAAAVASPKLPPAREPASPKLPPAREPAAPKLPPARELPATALTGDEGAYARFLPLAEAIAADQVKAFRADAALALHNVEAGVRAVTGARAALDARVRDLDWAAIEGLPALARAVCFAAAQVETTGLPGVGVADQLAEARKLRVVLLKTAEALAESGRLPVEAVDRIRAGHGFIDTANDCVDLAALFRKHRAKIAGLHALTPQQLARAAELGAELVAALKPKLVGHDGGAETPPNPPDPRRAEKLPARAAERRDRLWTLLLQEHRELRRLGAFHWIDEVDAHVPPLR
jgi:hypothetical protein